MKRGVTPERREGFIAAAFGLRSASAVRMNVVPSGRREFYAGRGGISGSFGLIRGQNEAFSGSGCGGAAHALALVFREVAFAKTDRLGRDFDQLVVGDELDGRFERELDGRNQAHGFIRA
mgnify:CR=1 FL=1